MISVDLLSNFQPKLHKMPHYLKTFVLTLGKIIFADDIIVLFPKRL